MEPTGRKDPLGVTCAECAHFICLSDQPTTDEFSVPCPSCRGRAWYLKSALRSQSVDWAAWLGDQLRKDQKTPYKTTVLRYVTEKINAITMTITGVRFLPSARLRLDDRALVHEQILAMKRPTLHPGRLSWLPSLGECDRVHSRGGLGAANDCAPLPRDAGLLFRVWPGSTSRRPSYHRS